MIPRCIGPEALRPDPDEQATTLTIATMDAATALITPSVCALAAPIVIPPGSSKNGLCLYRYAVVHDLWELLHATDESVCLGRVWPVSKNEVNGEWASIPGEMAVLPPDNEPTGAQRGVLDTLGKIATALDSDGLSAGGVRSETHSEVIVSDVGSPLAENQHRGNSRCGGHDTDRQDNPPCPSHPAIVSTELI